MPSLPPFIGRYEIRQRIGQGGMGALYLALDPAIDRLVALKLLRIDSDEMRARFLREARSAGRLQHPHIVTVYDVGEHDGQPFIAMEYVKGETLSDVIRRRAPVSLTWKISLMEHLCDGLDYAHRAGLVHRDIKPANLMVTNEADALKILDFGIARGVGDSGLTEVGTMMGTPNYMSPEQASGKPVDRRSDIFAVGAVIYEMLAYRQAFPGKEWQVVLPAILEKSPEPVTHVDRGLAPRLDTIVARALARDPVQRYQDLRSLRDDLADFRKQLGVEEQETALPTPVPGAEPTTAPPPRGAKARVDTDRARLNELRKAKVTGHVEAAEEALVSGDMEAAQAAAEEASLLDEEDTQVIRLLEKVHDARDAHLFQTNIAESEARLGDDALTAALRLVDDALELQPESSEARELRQRVLGAVEQRSRARERAQLLIVHWARLAKVWTPGIRRRRCERQAKRSRTSLPTLRL